ncbi:MAG: hybrid sensor histidine kinase/response regulator [Actinomycetota bacterium]|nr:hybrid sensor histidine kinase/response regulator [Actinomycetota bacterium]
MPTTDEEIMRQLMATFKLEADEHLQAMNELLLKLEKNKDNSAVQSLIEEVFREAHSLKGAARAVDAGVIESVAHGVENVFATAKRGEIETGPALFDLLYEALDRISAGLAALAEGCEPEDETGDLLQRLESAAKVGVRKTARRADRVKPDSGSKPTDAEPRVTKSKGGVPLEETIRVSTRKLDALMTHVEELLVSKIRTEQRLAELKDIKSALGDWHKSWLKTRGSYDRMRRNSDADFPDVIEFLARNSQNLKTAWLETNNLHQDLSKDTMRLSLITEDLQEDIRRVRMLPVATIFNSYGRMVRDLAREQGKQVELVITGSETELDKKVIEGIKDPLMHMLRNSIDHGIEKSEMRIAKGKPPGGTIWLSACQQGNGILIEVEDDGGGIDVGRVKETALARGLISSQELKTLTDEDAHYLIFYSGFSTASTITNVSGRGVGLDVVKKNIEQLNGLVNISTRRQGGTRFSINLPLTLSTSRVLLVNCCGEIYAIPTSSVERIVRVAKKDIYTVGTKETIDVSGRSLSLVRLAQMLELPEQTAAAAEDKLSVIILGTAEKRVAFAVDALEGETEIVIKSLGKMMARVRNVSGATILGTGKVVIILNIGDMIKSAKTYGHRKHDKALPEEAAADLAHADTDTKTVLVVDDSITTRIMEKNILESAGYNVFLANDGIEALATLRTNRCDLIVSDVDMPRMNGFDLTQKVKGDDRLRDMPVILVTALDSAADRERGLEAGADAYMIKHEFDQKNLLETIEQLI